MYQYKAKILRVVDGDTIDVLIDLGFNLHHKTRIRLYGIDTPECRTSDPEEKKYGIAAKKFVESKLQLDQNYKMNTFYDSKGKYGRTLGTIIVDQKGTTLNRLLLKAHLAVYYHGQHKNDIAKEHLINRSKVQL